MYTKVVIPPGLKAGLTKPAELTNDGIGEDQFPPLALTVMLNAVALLQKGAGMTVPESDEDFTSIIKFRLSGQSIGLGTETFV